MVPIKEALTFDDVTLVPKYSEILPSEVDTSTLFCKVLSEIFRFLPPLSMLLVPPAGISSEQRSRQHLKQRQHAQWDSLHKDSTKKIRKHSPKKNIQLIVTTGTFL